MAHVNPNKWAKKPGGWDKLNTEIFDPVLSAEDFPVIFDDQLHEPERLTQFRKPYVDGDAIHFFIDDYRFECLWNAPKKYSDRFRNMVICSPDYSLYTNWNDNLNRWNHYRKQWVGAYLQSEGIQVIPTVSWSNIESYQYCFSGIPKHSMVALSVIGCKKFSREFSQGFDEMMRQLEPHTILCLGEFDTVYRGNMLPHIVQYKWTFKSHNAEKQSKQAQIQSLLPGVIA